MKKPRTAQKGSALIYILIAIALLAALTASFMDSSSSQTSAQNTTNLVTELGSQINFIRGAIDECVLQYPGGDSTMPAAPALVGGYSITRPYPLEPDNTYLTSPTTSSNKARDIRCPGNPGNSNNHARIFGGSSGKAFPQTPSFMADWIYANQVDGVYLWTATNKTDAFLKTALQKLDTQFSKCEAEFIDASAGAKVVTSFGGTCAAGFLCFRVRIKPTATAVYPDETGCP